MVGAELYLPEEFRVGSSWRSKGSGGHPPQPMGLWCSQVDPLAGSCRWRIPVPLLSSSPLCLPLWLPAMQPSPFCSRSPTDYSVQLIGMAENLTSVVKSYKLSRLSKLWWCTRGGTGKAVGERSGGQEGGRSRGCSLSSDKLSNIIKPYMTSAGGAHTESLFISLHNSVIGHSGTLR